MFAAYLNSFRGERTGRKGLVSLREMTNYKHRERLEKNHLEIQEARLSLLPAAGELLEGSPALSAVLSLRLAGCSGHLANRDV